MYPEFSLVDEKSTELSLVDEKSKKAEIPAACSLPPHESWGLQWAQAKVFLIHPPEAPPLLDSN